MLISLIFSIGIIFLFISFCISLFSSDFFKFVSKFFFDFSQFSLVSSIFFDSLLISFYFSLISLLFLLAGTPIRPRPEEAENEEEEAKMTTGGRSRKLCERSA